MVEDNDLKCKINGSKFKENVCFPNIFRESRVSGKHWWDLLDAWA